MKAYGQFCPLAQSTQLLCERWTLLIIREFIAGGKRFGDLQKGLPKISPSLLSSRLKQLDHAGVIEKIGVKTYQLTEAGLALQPVIELLGAWGHKWARSKLGKDDLDADLLMWDMRRSLDPTIFPKQTVVVQFEYPDAPAGSKNWWLVSSNGEVDLCLTDNDYDVDLLVRCSLQVMTAVWICEMTFNDAVKSKQIKVIGDESLSKNLQEWLRTSPLSKLGAIDIWPQLDWSQLEN